MLIHLRQHDGSCLERRGLCKANRLCADLNNKHMQKHSLLATHTTSVRSGATFKQPWHVVSRSGRVQTGVEHYRGFSFLVSGCLSSLMTFLAATSLFLIKAWPPCSCRLSRQNMGAPWWASSAQVGTLTSVEHVADVSLNHHICKNARMECSAIGMVFFASFCAGFRHTTSFEVDLLAVTP